MEVPEPTEVLGPPTPAKSNKDASAAALQHLVLGAGKRGLEHLIGLKDLAAVVARDPSELATGAGAAIEEYATWKRSVFEPTRTQQAGGAAKDLLYNMFVKPFTEFPENPGGALVDLALTAPAVGLPVAGAGAIAATKAGKLLPAAVKAPVTKAIGKVVPRYNWPDEMFTAEAERAGERFALTISQTRASVEEAKKLGLPASRFLEPTSLLDRKELRAFKKQQKAAQQANPAAIAGTTRLQQPFTFTGKDVDLAMSPEGILTPVDNKIFATLPQAEKNSILKIRSFIESNQDAIVQRGIATPKEAIPGYLHRTYEAFLNPKEWHKTLMDPANPESVQTLINARAWINTRMPGADADVVIDRILGRAKHLQLQPGQPAVKSAVFGSEAGALLRRKKVPTALKELLGPMKPGAVRVGQTLDNQIRLLTGDAMMERMSQITAKDGRPLLYTGPIQDRDYFTLGTDIRTGKPTAESRFYGRWAGGHIHPDVADALETLRGENPWGAVSPYMTLWKMGKVVGNAPTHVNNITGDVMFGILSGGNWANPLHWEKTQRAFRETFSLWADPSNLMKHPTLQQAVISGAVVPGFASRELAHSYADVASRAGNWGDYLLKTGPMQKFARFYDLEDQAARYASYLILTEKYGKTPQEAALALAKSYPNYETSSQLGKFLRGQTSPAGAYVGAPFASFQLEAARIFLHAADENPLRLMAALSIPLGATILGMGAKGMTLEDYWEFQKSLPEGKRGRLLIPSPLGGDETYWHDLTAIIPMNELLQIGKGTSGIAGTSVPGLPMLGLFFSGPAIAPLELLYGIDLQTGAKLMDPARGESEFDAVMKTLSKISPTPSSLHEVMKRSYSKWNEAPYERWQEDPDTAFEIASKSLLPQVFRTTPESALMEQGRRSRGAQVGESKRGMRRIIPRPEIPEVTKERKLENLMKRREMLMERER